MPNLVRSLEFVVRRLKSTHYTLPTTHWRRRHLGFTLIELLVAITIIGILISVAAVGYTNAQRKGRDNKRKKDLNTVQQALTLYFEQNGKYPAAGTGADNGKIKCNAGADVAILTWWTSAFICNSVNYLDKLPQDPIYQSTGGYYFSSSGSPPNSYVISADLENDNDPERVTGPIPCTPYAGPPARDYCVTNP